MQSITSLTNLGYFVIPVHTPIGDHKCSCLNPKCTSIGKHPITSRGVHDASNNLKIVNGWLEKWPDCNVGIATSKISNLVVLAGLIQVSF
ncbi:MAG: bifunctional DNA primase/polymerase [Oligoflexales bacterium]